MTSELSWCIKEHDIEKNLLPVYIKNGFDVPFPKNKGKIGFALFPIVQAVHCGLSLMKRYKQFIMVGKYTNKRIAFVYGYKQLRFASKSR